MSNVKLHIISFAIPDPPNYGGVIDVYYKIKALAEQGVKIILHCYQYDDRQPSKKLAAICEEVHYYKREMSWRKAISTTPFIMASRNDKQLVSRLKKDNCPILFEGMHTAVIADQLINNNRALALRMHNLEWDYYQHLAQQESNIFKRVFYSLESNKLKRNSSILQKMNVVFTISPKEQSILSETYNNCQYLPVFHANNEVKIKSGKGKYILYQGNLTVAENKYAVNFIVSELYQKLALDIPIIIAGKMDQKAAEAIETIRYVEFKPNPTTEEMDDLVANAHIHLLPTFQSTGIKLKLINALYNGRFCVANTPMVAGTGLEDLCFVADTPQAMIDEIKTLWQQDFSTDMIESRNLLLSKNFSNEKSANQLIQWLSSLP